MSVPVLIGFAGVLVAAVATGMLAGRCVRQPRIALIVWTAATLALTVALAAESMGFERGFGAATFRAVQLFALLLTPLWLAWGLAEQLWPSEAARFGARLVCSALTVIGSVILATDPLTATAFGKSWPLASQHYQPPSHYALDAAQTVAVLITVAAAVLAAMEARNDPRMRSALVGAAPVGLAVLITAGLRFPLPDRSAYPLIGMAAARSSGSARPGSITCPARLADPRETTGVVRPPATHREPGAPRPTRGNRPRDPIRPVTPASLASGPIRASGRRRPGPIGLVAKQDLPAPGGTAARQARRALRTGGQPRRPVPRQPIRRRPRTNSARPPAGPEHRPPRRPGRTAGS